MKRSSVAVASALILSFSGAAFAQSTDRSSTTGPREAPEVSCADILATPSASAEDIAALNDTSVITVLRCQDADADAAAADPAIADLRTAAGANPTLAPRFTEAGIAADQVVAVRRGEDGAFQFYVIGAYR